MRKQYLLIIFTVMSISMHAQRIKNNILPSEQISKLYNPSLLSCPQDYESACFDPVYNSGGFEFVDSIEGITSLPTCLSCDLTKLKVRDQVEIIEQGIRQVRRIFYIEMKYKDHTEYGTCVQNILQVDQQKPSAKCISLATALLEIPAGGSGAPIVELWACDFNLGTNDSCTEASELRYFFDSIPPVVDSLFITPDTVYHINTEVPHYYNSNGFVDFNGDGTIYPKVKEGTLVSYSLAECHKWIPETNCAGKVFSCDDAPQTEIVAGVWDAALNYSSCSLLLSFGGAVGDCGGNGLIDSEQNGSITMYQNTPNPFNDQTSIKWEMETPGQLQFLIYSLQGELVYSTNKIYTKGVHTINLSKEDLNRGSGIYYYQFKSKTFSGTMKMIIID